MKYIIALAVLLTLANCYKKTESRTEADATSTVSTTTTETTTYSVDTSQVDTAAAGTAIDRAKEVAKDAAHKTGTALEKAGEEIQEKTDTRKDDDKKKPPTKQ